MQVSTVMKKRIYLPNLVPLCPLTQSHALSPQSLPKSVILNTTIGDVTSPTPIWTSKFPKSLRRNFSFLAPFAVSFPVFAAMATVFFYPHIFAGSVGRRILLVVPVDTRDRTSIISSSTVLLLSPFVNLSLAPLSLFLTYGPDLGVWPDCWVSAEFLRAPIPRKGSGSTTKCCCKTLLALLYAFCAFKSGSMCSENRKCLRSAVVRPTGYQVLAVRFRSPWL